MNVVFWAKDQVGTPCLVNGTYNSWSGDAEITITEIANGVRPERFLSKLDKCFKEAVPWIAEICAEKVIESAAEEYNLDIDRAEVMEQCFSGTLDYEAFYAYIVENFGDIDDDEDEFVSLCQDRWESDYFDEVYSFGWEYSTVNQGNLFYGRSNSDFAKGCTFLVSVSMFGETEDVSYAGETDINKKGLEKLADAIDSGKTESPRYENQQRKESYSLRNEAYTNFKRWASDIARNSVSYDWKVAGSRGNKDYPQWIWRDDLWVKKGDYSVSFSLAPDGDTVAFNIFKGDKIPLTRVFSKHCSKSDLADVVNEVEGKIPADLFKEVRTVLRAYRFKRSNLIGG